MSRHDRDRAGARVVLVMLVVLTVLAGGGYVTAYANSQNKTPRGTRVAGVNVGGRTILAAAAALRAGLQSRVERPITLDVGGVQQKIRPEDAGLGLDYVASVRQAGTGDGWEPERLWNYYTGGTDLDPVVTVSPMTMSDFLGQLAVTTGADARDGGVRFDHQGVEVVEPRPGRTIDPAQAQAAITAAYLSDDRTAHLDLVASAPTIDDAEVRRAVEEFANPAMSGSVALDLAQQHVILQPRDFAGALSMRAVNGRLEPHVREALLARIVRAAMPGAGKAVDASVALVGGRPHVTPDRPGVSFERAAVAAAFTAALTLPEGQRVAPVDVRLHDPKFTTEDAQHLRIEHRVAVVETTYPSRAASEVSRAAGLLDGTLLMPGDTFSWAAVAGTGYGPDALPVATALFNAAYEAGFGDVEHHAPPTFEGRSPAGRQATVDGGADLRFSVDSPYGVLLQVRSTAAAPGRPGTVKVVLWSTAAWDVTVTTSARYNLVEPGTTQDGDPGCVASPGRKGFSVDLSRHLANLADPAADRDEVVTTTYAPIDAVVCTPPATGRAPIRQSLLRVDHPQDR